MHPSSNCGGGGMEEDDDGANDLCSVLPEGLIASALSLTNPRDACRLSLVGSVFRSASEWDAVWERFLPPDYEDIIAESVDGGDGSLRFASKKELFLHLCDHPLLIDGGNKSFSLDKWSGKKCYMLAARDLSIVWGDTPSYWKWISLPESRFAEVAELISVCWLEIHGKISTRMLSPDTAYVAHLVFKSIADAYGFEYPPAEVCVGMSGCNQSEVKMVYLDPEGEQRRRYPLVSRQIGFACHRRVAAPQLMSSTKIDGKYPKLRGDGWLEIELGEYYVNKEGEEGEELVMNLTEVKGGNWKGGLIVQGIEIRPKSKYHK